MVLRGHVPDGVPGIDADRVSFFFGGEVGVRLGLKSDSAPRPLLEVRPVVNGTFLDLMMPQYQSFSRDIEQQF